RTPRPRFARRPAAARRLRARRVRRRGTRAWSPPARPGARGRTRRDAREPGGRRRGQSDGVMSVEPERLQKLLARAGLGSRRACEELIAAGRVTVDGEVARLGARADPQHQRVELDGVPVIVRDDLVYYVLNKPVGVVSTA